MALWALAGASLASGLFSANSASKAAKSQERAAEQAADAQLQGTRETIDLNRDIYNTNLGLNRPAWESGLANTAALNYALGTGARPDTLSFNYPTGLGDGGGMGIEYVPGSGSGSRTSGGGGGGVGGVDPRAGSPSALLKWAQAVGGVPNTPTGNRLRALIDERRGARPAQASAPGYYKVGDQQFSTREQAQAYVDKMRADNSFTPTYAGFAPMKEYYADLENLDNFRASPDYQFRKNEGVDAMRAAGAAGGLRLAGSTLRGIGDYSSNLADSEYTDYYNRGANKYYNWLNMLQGGAAQLPGATGAAANAGNTFASAAGNATMKGANATAQGYRDAGAAKASGYEGMANAFNGTMGNLTSLYTMNKLGAFG